MKVTACSDARYRKASVGIFGLTLEEAFFGGSKHYLPRDLESVRPLFEEATSGNGRRVANAAVGGLLLGPAGLVAGAMIGGKGDKSGTWQIVTKDGITANVFAKNSAETKKLVKLASKVV